LLSIVQVELEPRQTVSEVEMMKSASLTSAGCDGQAEMIQPSGRVQRCTCRRPRRTSHLARLELGLAA